MSEMLQEYVDSGSHQLRVDRSAGVIRGVKLLGLRSRNGRRYLENALAEAVSLYEGTKVNVNHPKGHPLAPRDYQDRIGVISGVEVRAGEGLFGDLHFNPKHALSEQLMWDAEHASQNVGLSHNVLARTSRQGDETVVEAITKVQSIDLVADPATTRGLFEQTNDHSLDGIASWDALTLEQLELHRPDLLEELKRPQSTELADARRRLDEWVAREAIATRREQVRSLLEEYELPMPQREGGAGQLVSEQFLESLMAAPDEAAVRRLVQDRAELVESASRWSGTRRRGANRPVSRDQGLTLFGSQPETRSAKEFAAAISAS